MSIVRNHGSTDGGGATHACRKRRCLIAQEKVKKLNQVKPAPKAAAAKRDKSREATVLALPEQLIEQEKAQLGTIALENKRLVTPNITPSAR